jgi:XTP/dITP diphosphohydrolase
VLTPSAFLLATRSLDKVREIRDILAPRRTAVLTLDELGIAASDAEHAIEAFDSFLANAHAKAAYFQRLTGQPTLADDSGISVDALHGAPGVHSKRFAPGDRLAGSELDRANNEHLLHLLRNSVAERTAHYTCAAVLHLPDGRRFAAIGTVSGTILHHARGENGFGYDPLFLAADSGRSFGEMSDADKQRYSHRARAFRALASLMPAP